MLLLAIALTGACADSSTTAGAQPAAGPTRESSTRVVRLQVGASERTVELRAEIAGTGAARSQGLMDRTHLAADAGMLFVYPRRQRPDAGFWMYRTHIPLDIAFLDEDGRILAIRSMAPCESDLGSRCPTYAPGVPYRAALEVNRGFFARNGINVGDRVLSPSGVPFRRAAE